MFLLRLFFGLFSFCVSFFVSADHVLTPYAGVDLQQRNMNLKKNYGDNVFSRKSFQNNIYFGFRINEHFGLETGYQSSESVSMNNAWLWEANICWATGKSP